MTTRRSPAPQRSSPSGAARIYDLVGFEAGDLVGASVPRGAISTSARLTGLAEIFVVVAGRGELWRHSKGDQETVSLEPIMAATIPAGIDFQYRIGPDDPLELLVATLPRWEREGWGESTTRMWGPDQSRPSGRSPPLRAAPWTTVTLPQEPSYRAPDGSEIRLLPTYDAGGVAHCRLPAGGCSVAHVHPRVEELWYVLSGRGELWRRRDEHEEVVTLAPGTAITLPVGTSFQFRTSSLEAMELIIVTIPRWVGAEDAVGVPGRW